eukprot:s1868_g5.t1
MHIRSLGCCVGIPDASRSILRCPPNANMPPQALRSAKFQLIQDRSVSPANVCRKMPMPSAKSCCIKGSPLKSLIFRTSYGLHAHESMPVSNFRLLPWQESENETYGMKQNHVPGSRV